MTTARYDRTRPTLSQSVSMKLAATAWLTALLLLEATGPASAAGGGGTSFCSHATKPDGVLVIGDLSTYANPGEFVTALAPLPGNPGSGWGVQNVCNPNRFAP
jgi:hypothetical protein